jgi:hypothetical protein
VTASVAEPAKLPLWRLIAGIAVLSSFVAVLIMLAPAYIDNFLLDRYMRELAAQPASVTAADADLVAAVVGKAKELDLPVRASGVEITRTAGKPRIRIAKYGVQMNLVIYQVDLHFPEATSR